MIFQFFCSLFVVTRHDVDGCLNLGPSEIGYHVHLVEHSTRVGVLLFAVLHRAEESQPAQNSCPRLPHSVDSRFGLYHVAVVPGFAGVLWKKNRTRASFNKPLTNYISL